ncbi:MAG: aldehyde dehydrogenase family protein [Halioglobus sp.]|nr:aldehyde dehydrogenase family protein [Halioglobus sp.]
MIRIGSGQTGRSVMALAANNLTPVVLELGGKAPDSAVQTRALSSISSRLSVSSTLRSK